MCVPLVSRFMWWELYVWETHSYPNYCRKWNLERSSHTLLDDTCTYDVKLTRKWYLLFGFHRSICACHFVLSTFSPRKFDPVSASFFTLHSHSHCQWYQMIVTSTININRYYTLYYRYYRDTSQTTSTGTIQTTHTHTLSRQLKSHLWNYILRLLKISSCYFFV